MKVRKNPYLSFLLVILPLFVAAGTVFGALKYSDGHNQPHANSNPNSAMSSWRAALKNRSHKAAKWVAVGESITEGQGASQRSDRWLNLTTRALRSNYPVSGVTGGENYIPAIYRVGTPDSPWTNPWEDATGDIEPTYNLGSLGYRALKISAGSNVTYTLKGDSVDIWYATGKDLGRLQYTIDNRQDFMDTSDESSKLGMSSKNVPLGKPGTHAITISAEDKPVYLAGFTVYNGDHERGIQVYDSGFGGATAATFLQDIDNFKNSLKQVSPKLITIELGINDYTVQTPPSKFKSQMHTLVDVAKSLPSKPSIELIIPYVIYNKTKAGYSYNTYASQLLSIAAAERGHITILDLRDHMPPADLSGNGDYATDGIHPNAQGQHVIKGLVYESITR